MESEFQKYELIEQYLSGTLKGEALNDFNAMLSNDPKFQKEIALHKDIEIGLMEQEDIPFIKTLNEIYENESAMSSTEKTKEIYIGESIEHPQKSEPGKPKTIVRYLKIVAAVAAILFAGIFINQFFKQSLSPIALSEKWIGEPLEQSSLRNQTTRNERLNNAYKEMESKNYEGAIKMLLDIYENKMDLPGSGLALGYAYIQNSQHKEASEIFNQLLKKTNLKNSDQINWYLAHSYLRNKQFSQSIAVLENMLSNPSVTPKKKEEAKVLMEAIRKQFL